MRIVEDWAKEPIAMLGIVFEEGERGQSVVLSKREMDALRRAQSILEQLRLAVDPHKNADYGDYTPVTERVTSAEAFLGELIDDFPEGRLRVDLFDCGRDK